MTAEPNQQEPTDHQWIRQILEGDERQFRHLVERYQSRITNLVALVTGNRNEAEDICQKIFIKVFYSLEKFDLSLPFFPWLYRVTVNQCYDEMRRTRRKKQTFFSDIEAGEAEIAIEPALRPDRTLEQENVAALVQRLLLTLPSRYREVLILKDIADYSYAEISEILGCSMQAVRLKVFRARNMLRKKITNLVKEERHLLSNY